MTKRNATAGGLAGPLFMALAAAHASGCGSSQGSGGATAGAATGVTQCVVNASAQPICPSPAPSYAKQIKNIIDTNCQACHASGGIGATAAVPGRPRRDVDDADDADDVDDDSASRAVADPNRSRPPRVDPDTAHDWSVLANIQRSGTRMMQTLFLCEMPPADASTLTPEDRATLASWLKCGAPDN